MKKGILLLLLWIVAFTGGVSGQVTTPLAPIADAYVRNDSYATLNFGTETKLDVKGTNSVGYARNSYLKFALSQVTGTVVSAKLRVYGYNTENTTGIAMSAYSANTDSWTETGINYNNRPGHPSTALSVASINNVAKYIELDVTAFVKTQIAGDKIASFVLKNASKQKALVTFNSRENSANPPQLLITTSSPQNSAPVLGAIGNKEIVLGETLSFTATATDPNAGQSKTFSLIDAPAGANIGAANGNFSWTPAASGTVTFTVQVTDNGTPALNDTEKITVTVNAPPVNQPPVLDAIGNRNVIVGQKLSFTATATDPNAGQTKTFTLTGAPAGAEIGAATGVFSWTPGATGPVTFTVQVSDNGDPVEVDTEEITVTVTEVPPNSAPVLDPIGNQDATVAHTLTFTATASDVDTWQTKTFSIAAGPGDATIDPASGLFSWTPSALGSFQFTIRVTDNGSPEKTDEEQIIVTVNQANDNAPVLGAIGNKTVIVGNAVAFTAQATDADAGQALNFYLIDAPAGAEIDATTGAFSWTPDATGTYIFSVNVSDNGSPALSDDEQITVTVNAVNVAPVLSPIGGKNTSVGQALSFIAKANDDNSDQAKVFSLIGAPNGASINPATGAFSWTPTTGGSFRFTVRVTDNGTPALYDEEQVTVTVSSSTVNLSPVADAFVRNGIYANNNYGSNDSLLTKTYNTAADFTRNAYLKFSLSSLSGVVTSAKLRVYGRNIDNTTSISISAYGVNTDTWTESAITWNNAPAAASTTAASSVGVDNVAKYFELDVTAFVKAQLSGDKTVSLLLKNASNQNKNVAFNSRENTANQPQLVVSTTTPPSNQSPILAAIGNKAVNVGQKLSFTATATDPDAGQTKTFSLIGAPAGANINATSGAFEWTPTAAGTYQFTVRVTDNGTPVLYDEAQISVTVNGAVTTATFSGAQNVAIPNPGTVSVPINVSGLPSQMNLANYGLQSVQVQITHPADKELTLQLKSPDGKLIYLFRKSPGVNINTTFDGVALKFIDNNEIATYTGSFTSGYRPRQELSLLNNGQNPNGTWNLVVKDDAAASTAGVVGNVSLVFGPNPAKPLLTSSTLPIIKIYTASGVDIPDDPKVLADLYIINNANGAINEVNQTNYEYQGKIGIEIRGNSSATNPTIPKRQYGFETRAADGVTSIDVSLMGMPAKDDWILSAVQSDKALMRNVLTYQIAREMGQWASRTKYCEVIINDEYRGVFIFQEKIKRDKNRVDVEKPGTVATDPAISGGYIFSVDDLDPGDKTWTTKYEPKPGNPYKFVYPKPEDVTSAQRTYLQNYVGDFEDALHGDNFKDLTNGFRKYGDDKSFIDFFLINEFAKNNDAYRYSTYFYKKRNGKIVAGPVWDFDRAYRNEATCNSALISGYIYIGTNNCEGRVVPWWWSRMLEDPKYKQDMICRYNTLRQSTLSLQRLYTIIDSSAAVLNDGAQQRNFIRWNIMGKYVTRIPKPYSATYAIEIQTMKQWIKDRLEWLDNDLGPCTQNARVTKIEAKPANNLQSSINNVYPSPFTDMLFVSLNISKAQQVDMQLVDMNGKVIYRKMAYLPQGTQNIQLDLKGKQLASGLYMLHLKGDNLNMVKKILKD